MAKVKSNIRALIGPDSDKHFVLVSSGGEVQVMTVQAFRAISRVANGWMQCVNFISISDAMDFYRTDDVLTLDDIIDTLE